MHEPVYCHGCGHRMIPVVYRYDPKNRKKAWLCTHCGQLVRFVRMLDGRQIPVQIWRGHRRKIIA